MRIRNEHIMNGADMNEMRDYNRIPLGILRIPRNLIKEIFDFTPREDEEILYNPNNVEEPFYFNAEDYFTSLEFLDTPFANKQQLEDIKSLLQA